VIFVTVGTHPQPFSRLLDALGPLAELDELVVQHGAGPAPAEATLAEAFLPAREVVDLVQHARAVVMHAGIGSFLVAWRAGHVPILVPRQRALGEHVDDHQAEIARTLARHGQAVAVWDIADLAPAVRNAPPMGAPRVASSQAIQGAVRRALDGRPVGASPREYT
jgi:UDP-N-acetylglucosamine transferase subunit ALG13